MLHDRETTPDSILFARSFECSDFWAVEGAHDLWLGEHGKAVDTVFREDNHVHLSVGCASLFDEGTDMVCGVLQVAGSLHGEELGLAEADYDGI